MTTKYIHQMMTAFIAAGLCAISPSSGVAQSSAPLSVELSLVKTNKRLEREATIVLKTAQGLSVSNASIEVTVDMPSMPMMHKIPKAVAVPTGEPGAYKARFTLEMPGEWAAHIEVLSPNRTKVVKKFFAD